MQVWSYRTPVEVRSHLKRLATCCTAYHTDCIPCSVFLNAFEVGYAVCSPLIVQLTKCEQIVSIHLKKGEHIICI